jgi:hypothetical protein
LADEVALAEYDRLIEVRLTRPPTRLLAHVASRASRQRSRDGARCFARKQEAAMTIVPVPGPWETHSTGAGLDRSIALNPDGHSPEFIAIQPRPLTDRMMLSERNKSHKER